MSQMQKLKRAKAPWNNAQHYKPSAKNNNNDSKINKNNKINKDIKPFSLSFTNIFW